MLLPLLAAPPQPLALLEVGRAVPIPARLPGSCGAPASTSTRLDLTDPDDVRWLTTLIWPEHEHRRARLAAAVEVARAEPPHLVAGDLNEELTALAGTAPRDATLVDFPSAVLAYLDTASRAAFVDTVRGLDARWIASEVPARSR